jgi:hypothetical protein
MPKKREVDASTHANSSSPRRGKPRVEADRSNGSQGDRCRETVAVTPPSGPPGTSGGPPSSRGGG